MSLTKAIVMNSLSDQNIAYSALITVEKNAAGSGFLFNTRDHLFIVTARHVILNSKTSKFHGATAEIICQTRDLNDDSITVLSVNFNQLYQQSYVIPHQRQDVAAFVLGNIKWSDKINYEIEFIKGVVPQKWGNSALLSVSVDTVQLLDQVKVANDVFLYGYPSSLGVNLDQFDSNKPLLRRGTIASTYPKKGTIILDLPAYPGNSGGPVVQISRDGDQWKHHVIGVVIQFVPFKNQVPLPGSKEVIQINDNSGYSIAVAMDHVFELLGIDSS